MKPATFKPQLIFSPRPVNTRMLSPTPLPLHPLRTLARLANGMRSSATGHGAQTQTLSASARSPIRRVSTQRRVTLASLTATHAPTLPH